MGRVYVGRLAARHGVQRLVAIKLLRTVPSPSARAALLREARVTARLYHRNIVPTLELDEHDRVPFVVMELVDGGSLAGLLLAVAEARQRLPVPLAAWIVAQTAAGLHAAHELTSDAGAPLGLVHRDISPQNVLLSMDGRVLLADFGVAKLASGDETTESGVIKGKYAYMSPEQAQGEPLDRRSDVFSLGLVLYEALTGRRAFPGDRPAQQLLRILNDDPEAPAALRPEVDAELSAITMRCLAKEPDGRFATALELSEALRAWSRHVSADADEAELGRWMHRFVGEARRELLGRVQTSIEALDAAPSSVAAKATMAAAQPGSRSWSAWARGVGAGAGAAVTTAVIAWAATATPGRPAVRSPPSVSSAAAPPGVLPSAPPVAIAPAPASVQVELDASVASVAPPPLPPRTGPRSHPAKAAAIPRASVTPPPSPSGKPFESL